MQRLATKGGKKRQIRCRFLSLGFEPHFSRTISLGDGVSKILFADAGKTKARFLNGTPEQVLQERTQK
jgi:hypothetical protein